MPELGKDCDFTLQHPAVNSGAAVGFVLDRQKVGGVEIERQAYKTPTDTWADRVKYSLRVAVGDSLTQPDGNQSAITGAQLYACLQAFLQQRTGITLEHKRGVVQGLHASLECADELLSVGRLDVVTLTLNNGGFNEFVPIDLIALNASIYDSGTAYDQGFWR